MDDELVIRLPVDQQQQERAFIQLRHLEGRRVRRGLWVRSAGADEEKGGEGSFHGQGMLAPGWASGIAPPPTLQGGAIHPRRGYISHVLTTTTALRFENVRRRFGRLSVLRGVSGAVGPGEMLLVTGPNGSGKSTLLRCLAGLLAPDAGTIDYREDDREESGPLDAAERRRRVGVVAPDLAFYAELTVRENLEFFARLRRVGPERGLA